MEIMVERGGGGNNRHDSAQKRLAWALFVINPCVLSVNRVDLGLFFCFFLLFTPLQLLHKQWTKMQTSDLISYYSDRIVVGGEIMILKTSLRFENDRQNIDSLRRFIDKFSLFSNRSEALIVLIQQKRLCSNFNINFKRIEMPGLLPFLLLPPLVCCQQQS